MGNWATDWLSLLASSRLKLVCREYLWNSCRRIRPDAVAVLPIVCLPLSVIVSSGPKVNVHCKARMLCSCHDERNNSLCCLHAKITTVETTEMCSDWQWVISQACVAEVLPRERERGGGKNPRGRRSEVTRYDKYADLDLALDFSVSRAVTICQPNAVVRFYHQTMYGKGHEMKFIYRFCHQGHASCVWCVISYRWTVNSV